MGGSRELWESLGAFESFWELLGASGSFWELPRIPQKDPTRLASQPKLSAQKKRKKQKKLENKKNDVSLGTFPKIN
jgi:enterochelin esterase-like enzyme